MKTRLNMTIDDELKKEFRRWCDESLSSKVEKMIRIYIDEAKKMGKRVEKRVRG